MNILVVHGRTRNLGDAAILHAMEAQLRDAFPGGAIAFDSDAVGVMREDFPGRTIVPAMMQVADIRGSASRLSPEYLVGNAAFLVRVAWRYAQAFACVALGLRGRGNPLLDAYREADLVVWAGGDYVADVYGPRIWLRLAELWVARRLGKKTAIYSQTFGPFARGRHVAARMLRRADLLLSRDEGSYAFLASLGLSDRTRKVADCVIAMPPVVDEGAAGAEALRPLRGAVAFALIDPHYVRCDAAGYARYERAMLAAMREAEREGERVVLVAAASEDAAAARAFLSRHRLTWELTELARVRPDAVKGALAGVRMLVSSRMHPVIMATSEGVPVVGVSSLAKMRDYLALTGLDDLALPIAGLGEDDVAAAVRRLRAGHARYLQSLKSRLPSLRAASMENARAVRSLFP